MIAQTPKPPYYAVIFTSIRTEVDEGYAEMAQKMDELAKEQPGYLGFESARDGIGISISYWKDLESIKSWKSNLDHQVAQEKGRKVWYRYYHIRIAKVERDYKFG
ncbi:MAG: antibiotic biosynthesis monooxygenase family protein [Bacteroidota bacterium]